MFKKAIDLFKFKQLRWHEPGAAAAKEQCPCCDYVTLSTRGYYQICPVCFWEDDGQDVDALDIGSGPNHGITLREGRNNFKQFGSCELAMKKHVLAADERDRFEHKPRHF